MSTVQIMNTARQPALDRLRETLNRWLLPALLLLALALRLYMLSTKSFWADELDQILYGQGTVAFTLSSTTPPIDYLITHLIVHYVGTSEFIVRLPDVVWGVLAVFMVCQLGRTLFDRPTGYLAAFLLAILPLHIQYSQEARYYSLPTFLFILCVYTAVQVLNRPTRIGWFLYSVTGILALFTHLYAAPLLALLGLWVVLIKRPSRSVLIAFIVATGIPSMLFILWFLSERGSYLFSRAIYGSPLLLNMIAAPFFDLSLGFKIFTAQNGGSAQATTVTALNTVLWIVVIYWSLLIVALIITLHRRTPGTVRTALSLCLIVAFGGLLASFVVDYVTQYFFDPRQFVFFTPYICLSIAASYLTLIRSSRLRFFKNLSVDRLTGGSILGLAVVSLLIFWTPIADVYAAPTQDWRSLAQNLVQTMEAEDALISPFTAYLGFYQPTLLTRTPPGMLESVTGLWSRGYPNMPLDAATMSITAKQYKRLWIILLGPSSYQRPPALTDWIAANHLTPQRYSQDIEVYIYPLVQ